MPKRVAITIAGAVSLGSYEAGVTYELLEAFRTWNEAAGRTEDEKIYIDVLTGASAGGMTAMILAQCLMFYGSKMQDPFDNPLYNAWVKEINLTGLVHLKPDEKPWHSLLSSDLIEAISRKMLIDSMVGITGPAPHACVETDKTPIPLLGGVALTNVNGVDYVLPIAGSDEGGFNYTKSADQRLFKIEPTSAGDAALWEDVRSAAVACGAFPAAFRPQEIKRKVGDYGVPLPPLPDPPPPPPPPALGVTYVDWGQPPKAKGFAYTDGGILQNQPLGMAKNFVNAKVHALMQEERVEEAVSMASDRLYAFISPNPVRSSATTMKAADLSIFGLLRELVHVYVRQASFHDWIVAEGMNESVRVLDERASELAKQIASGGVQWAALMAASRELNPLLLRPQTARNTYLRLQKQYATEVGLIMVSDKLPEAQKPGAAQAFVEAIATLESAAQLELRDKMKIVAVMANGRTELAGSGIAAFVGFFSEEFRKYDYWVGRCKARLYLQRKDVKTILGFSPGQVWPQEAAWGSTPELIRTNLKNPTGIASVPLSFSQMIKPALRPLWYMLRIRPAIFRTLLFSLAGIGLSIAGLLSLLALIYRYVRH